MSPAAGNALPGTGIARRKGEPSTLDFEALRARGIALAQGLSGSVWTDYNLHDPGVTLLESLCYALTEGVYDAGHPVPAVLGGPEGVLDLPRHSLHPPSESLPSRPVTAEDYQRCLLDEVPELERTGMEPLPPAEGTPPGLWRMAPQAAAAADPAVAAERAARAYLARRNLCEDLATWPAGLKARECSLELEFSIHGSREAAEVLAEILIRCARSVARVRPRQSAPERLGQGLAQGLSLAELLEGPPNRNGWTQPEPRALEGDTLFFGDFARELASVEGVEEIRSLRLIPPAEPAGEEPSVSSMPRQGPDWSLRLRWPRVPADLAGIRAFRAGARVSLAAEALLARLADLNAAPPALRGDSKAEPASSPLALPEGMSLAEAPYFPAQNHLPPAYQGAASPALLGYLALFEQWMAHAQAQRRHLRDLFTSDAAPMRSYWWDMLDEHKNLMPGLDALYRQEPAKILAEVFEPLDGARERKGRVLDFLLGLHGVDYGQERLRPFGWYFSAAGWERHRFECKRRLLADIVPLTRDRAGGFDYTRPSLDVRDNTPALQRRVSLELGFRRGHSRSLTRAFSGLGLELSDPGVEHADRLARAPEPGPGWRPALPPEILDNAPLALPLEVLHIHLGPLRPGPHPAFWRCAVHPERYWLDWGKDGARLLLGPDEDGRWWRLASRRHAERSDGPALEDLARNLRDLAIGTQYDSEGLHLVEHLLLLPQRPGQAARGNVPPDFYGNRLSVVFAGWTARGADASFRRLAEDTLARHLSAHLDARCLWLDFQELREFEGLYRAWLDAKRLGGVQPGDARDAAIVDLHAGALRLWLWERAGLGPGASGRRS